MAGGKGDIGGLIVAISREIVAPCVVR